MRLIDTHAHLTRHEFADEVEETIARADAAGVTRIINIGAAGTLAACEEAVALAERHPNVWATIGYHPHEAKNWCDEAAQTIERLARHPRVVGIGETGLDYHYMYSPKETQAVAFRESIRLARRVDLPLIIHTREADDETVAILREEQADSCGGVIHCFSGSWSLAEAALDLGFNISFTGILTFRRSDHLREIAKKIPLDRLMVETDCPFLAPVPHRGKRNEPAYVVKTAECLADVVGMPLDALAEVLTANAERFFKLPPVEA